MHCHGGFKVKQNRFESFLLSNVYLWMCVMYHAIYIHAEMTSGIWCFWRWFEVDLTCVFVCSQSELTSPLNCFFFFCLFVFCFLFITLSALAEHLGIEFMGMNRSFLLVCRFVGLEAWACFLQLQLVSFCSWRDQTAITYDWRLTSLFFIILMHWTSDGCLEPLCRFLGF